MSALAHELAVIFGWPYGIVVGNLLSSVLWLPLALFGGYLFRNKLMRRFVALHHYHKTEHAKTLAKEASAHGGHDHSNDA